MNHFLKNTVKFAVCTCVTLGAVAVAVSVVGGINVGKLVSAGFKGAKNAVEEELTKRKTDSTAAEESDMLAEAEETEAETDEASPEAFEN